MRHPGTVPPNGTVPFWKLGLPIGPEGYRLLTVSLKNYDKSLIFQLAGMNPVCIAIISSDNSPLLLRTSSGYKSSELDLMFLAHSSLDVIEEKLTIRSTAVDQRELYLGQLYPTEQYKIYGYVTNSKVKILVMTENTSQNIDQEVKSLFKQLHRSYTQLISNPFYNPGEKIESPHFIKYIEDILQ